MVGLPPPTPPTHDRVLALAGWALPTLAAATMLAAAGAAVFGLAGLAAGALALVPVLIRRVTRARAARHSRENTPTVRSAAAGRGERARGEAA